MKPTAWSLVPLSPAPFNRRHWHNRFLGVKDMTNVRTVADPAVAAALKQATAPRPVISAPPLTMPDEPTPVFASVVADMKFDPTQPITAPQGNRNQRRRAQREGKGLTDRVWDSINADGTIDPDKAVPVSVANTGELPLVQKAV